MESPQHDIKNPFESPSAVASSAQRVGIGVFLLQIAGGVSLFTAAFVLSTAIVMLLLYEFVLGDDYSELLWLSLPIGAVPATLAVAWYVHRLSRGSSTVFVILVTMCSSLVWGGVIGSFVADRLFDW